MTGPKWRRKKEISGQQYFNILDNFAGVMVNRARIGGGKEPEMWPQHQRKLQQIENSAGRVLSPHESCAEDSTPSRDCEAEWLAWLIQIRTVRELTIIRYSLYLTCYSLT